ncbi:T9SS type A sorting domain-containing protein [Flavobacterium sp.]|uniref:T9SS type A sorting domain-containing protein n=1 Tax=Flavobacterium sp. TaxID=239 RepID=UPI0008D49C37|nr:T9SS type A sorting domain-containing protein [Flavobacterium sp.]OGS62852.1 MAG: internalin [Flavobacteria bacterium GWF1_32_7]HBD26054.1 T9SS C-terminal target domain-containing protein [Flavobacterium sp.]
MKKLYFLFFLIIGFLGNAQIVNIPDANFKARLISLGVDTNNDGNIQLNEAHQLTYLDIGGQNINDLTGINNFINLTFLESSGNNLSTLNITGLLNLVNLRCYNCNLTSLNLINLPNLRSLHCYANNLTTINLSSLTKLEQLICDNNRLTTLDLSNSSNLNEIRCWNNQLESLNLKNGKIESTITIFNNPNLRFICCDEEQLDYIQSQVLQYGILNCSVNSYCSFTPGGTYYNISGNTKLDSNNNGCDALDINYSNLNFSITDGTNAGSLIANQKGNYNIPVSAGNHTITPNLENPSYFNIFPTSFTVDFPTQTSPFTQDFCVTANGVHHDVEVVLIPTVPARPGFEANYKLVYRNKGNQVENGSISLTFDDDKLDYVSSNPVFNSTAVNNLTWDYTNLQPFETREIALVLNVNSPMEIPAVNIGDQINFLAEITPFANDEVQYDNIFALKQIVVGSYDPNDKTCIQGETITPTEVGNYVHYVIRFENTGTYPAENIVVKDVIDLTKFDITTLVPLKSSHDFFTRISGNKVEFIFENINLDFNDATNDGYVVFKIKTLPSLVLGDTFTNNANIYFDYNFPITTNTYSTTVATLSMQDFDFGTYFTLYPNPAKDVLNIQTKQDLAVNSIEIYNQLGQIVMAVTNAVNAVDVANLASGTYFVKVNTEKGSANAKFVKE